MHSSDTSNIIRNLNTSRSYVPQTVNEDNKQALDKRQLSSPTILMRNITKLKNLSNQNLLVVDGVRKK